MLALNYITERKLKELTDHKLLKRHSSNFIANEIRLHFILYTLI